MASDYIVKDDLGFNSQLKNFKTKLPEHLEVLGITKEDAADANMASDFYDFVIQQTLLQNERKLQWNTFKSLVRVPGNGQPPMTAMPTTLEVPQPPPSVALGIEDWFRKLVKRIKGSKNYTDAIGRDLGIVAVNTEEKTTGKKPAFTIQLVAGQPLINWSKLGMDGVEIWKDSGDGHYTMLVFDQRPNHLDTNALPARGSSAVWKYKMIYRYKDERVGEWSDEQAVTVLGIV